MNAVKDGELLTEVRLEVRRGAGSAHEKVERRAGDWAIAAASAAGWLEGGRVGGAGAGSPAAAPAAVCLEAGPTADARIPRSPVGMTTIHLTRAEEALRGQAPGDEL